MEVNEINFLLGYIVQRYVSMKWVKKCKIDF